MTRFDSVPVPDSWTKINAEPTGADQARRQMLDRMGLIKPVRTPDEAREQMMQRHRRPR